MIRRRSLPEFPTFASLEALLSTKPDVVLIATPPGSHLPLAKAALKAGAHVFCEKPLANSVEEADEIAAAATAAKRQVCVNSEFPFMPTHLAVAREIGSQRFGRLLFVEAHQTFVVTSGNPGRLARRGPATDVQGVRLTPSISARRFSVSARSQ